MVLYISWKTEGTRKVHGCSIHLYIETLYFDMNQTELTFNGQQATVALVAQNGFQTSEGMEYKS